MRSVPRQINHRGDHLSMCDTCGVMYLRSSLRRCQDGLLRCTNDLPGRNELELAKLTAARASALSQRLGRQPISDGARPDVDSTGQVSSSSSYTGTTRRRTIELAYENDMPTYANPGTKNNYSGF